MSAPWTRKEFEDKLREKGKGYHIYHPFHVMMYEGKLSKEQLQSWVMNRFLLSNKYSVEGRSNFIKLPSERDKERVDSQNSRP
jgi:pyrroloquinoline quinone (PQQ) biosynthesis protein C